MQGGELYHQIKSFLQDHLSQKAVNANMMDEALLLYYTQNWKEFTTSASTLNHILAYLNRHWVKRELDEGVRGVYDIYTVLGINSVMLGVLERLFVYANSRQGHFGLFEIGYTSTKW